jgi:hypothetical protein
MAARRCRTTKGRFKKCGSGGHRSKRKTKCLRRGKHNKCLKRAKR